MKPSCKFWASIAVQLIFAVAVGLHSIRANQLSPHHVQSIYCGKVLADYYTTNPVSVRFETRQVVTSNGLQTVTVQVTNQLWTVWTIFK